MVYGLGTFGWCHHGLDGWIVGFRSVMDLRAQTGLYVFESVNRTMGKTIGVRIHVHLTDSDQISDFFSSPSSSSEDFIMLI